MKTLGVCVVFVLFAFSFAYGADTVFGSIDYIEGNVVMTRSAKTMDDLNIGDSIFVNDMIKTGSDGVLVIALDKRTGMRGTLSVKSKSVIYIRLAEDKTSPKTTIELMAGQVASKVAKLAGSPSMQVKTQTTAMGVRGTQFGVSTSVNGSVMIYCTEGAVECRDESETFTVGQGKALEKRPAERMRFLAAAISSPEEFEKKWMADEIEVFKGGAAKFLVNYEKQYASLLSDFNTIFDAFQKSAVLGKWLLEDREGKTPGSTDPAVMREKKEMIAHIQKLRKNLFIFERIYYRIAQIEDIVSGTAIEKAELRPGVTVSDFLRRFRADRDSLARRIALFRYAEKLYELRNRGGSGMPGMSGLSDEDFFGESDF
jgi:hypothetical protein